MNHAQAKSKDEKGVNKTEYAKACGYKGDKPVIVHDGRVLSHRSVRWEYFIQKVKTGRI